MSKPTVAKPTALSRDLPQPRPQVAIITTPGRVAHRRPVHAEDRTRPTLADAEQLPSMLDSLPLSGGPHQFFAATSFRPALSSIASASSRLRRAFSSSSPLRLRACDPSIPPYLAFPASRRSDPRRSGQE